MSTVSCFAVPRSIAPTEEQMAAALGAALLDFQPPCDGEIFATIVPSMPIPGAPASDRGAWVFLLRMHAATTHEEMTYPLARALRARFGAITLIHRDDRSAREELCHFDRDTLVADHMTSGEPPDRGAIELGSAEVYGEHVVVSWAMQDSSWLVWRPGGPVTPEPRTIDYDHDYALELIECQDLAYDLGEG